MDHWTAWKENITNVNYERQNHRNLLPRAGTKHRNFRAPWNPPEGQRTTAASNPEYKTATFGSIPSAAVMIPMAAQNRVAATPPGCVTRAAGSEARLAAAELRQTAGWTMMQLRFEPISWTPQCRTIAKDFKMQPEQITGGFYIPSSHINIFFWLTSKRPNIWLEIQRVRNRARSLAVNHFSTLPTSGIMHREEQ